MVWALLILSIVAFAVLAMRRAPLWQWAVAALVIGALTRISTDNGLWLMTDGLGWVFALLPAAILGLLALAPLRKAILTGPAYGVVKSILPRVSRTEQEALDAGTVGWDAELFSGRPDWTKLLGVRKPTLSTRSRRLSTGHAKKSAP